MTKQSMTQPPHIVLGQKIGAMLSSRAPAGQRFSLAITELHKNVVRAGRFTSEFNGFFVQLLTLYKDSNYILNDAIISGRQPAETIVVETALNHFIANVIAEYDAGLIRLPMAKKQIEEVMPFAHFYAGLFALARGANDKALDYFLKADEFEALGFKGKDLAEAVASDTAVGRLNGVIALIKQGFTLSSEAPVTVRQPLPRRKVEPRPEPDLPPPPPAPAAPKGPTAQDIGTSKKLTDEGEQFAARRDYINALKCLFSALNYNPANASAQTALKHVLGFFDRWFKADIFTQKEAPYEELQQIKGLLAVKPDFVPGLVLAAWYSFALNESRQAIEYIQAALQRAGEGKEKQYALFVAGFIYYRLRQNNEAITFLEQIDPKSDIFPKAVNVLAINYEYTKDGQRGLDLMKRHGSALERTREAYYKAAFLLMLGGTENLQEASRLVEAAYESLRRSGKPFGRLGPLRDQIQVAQLKIAEEARKVEEAKRAEAAVAEEAARKAAEEAEEEAVPPTAPPVEPTQDHAELSAKERELHALQAAVRQRQQELDDREKEIEAKKLEAIRLLDERFEKLREWQAQLAEREGVLVAKETASSGGRQVIEVVRTEKEQRFSEIMFRSMLMAIIKNDFNEVERLTVDFLRKHPGDANAKELLAWIRLNKHKELVAKDEGLSRLQQELLKANAANEQLKTERTDLKKQLQELERQLQEARLANETLRKRLAELAGGGASEKPKTFMEAWMWLSSKSPEELAQIDPILKTLFQAEEGKGRGAALTPAMIIERRRNIIRLLIDAHLNEGQKISSFTLAWKDQQLAGYVANKRLAPNGFDSIRQWTNAIFNFMKGQT